MNKNTYIKFGIICVLIIAIGIVSALLILNKNEAKENNEINNTEVINEEPVEIINSYYDYSKFDMSNTFYTYEDDTYTSIIGIDVSEHNETIDFNKVKQEGIEFVFIRLGWRGYTEGGLYIDNKYYRYMEDAKAAGLKIGVYFFSQAINEDEAKKEAELVLDTLGNTSLDLPVVYDYENITGDEARTDNLTKEEITNNALSFFKTIGDKYDVMLYGNKYILETYYDMDKLANYKLWFAQYHDEPETPYEFSIWQYNDNATIDGIEKETDLNIMMIKK